MNSPVYVKHDYIDGCLYMLRDSLTVHTGEKIDEFPAGEVFIYNGEHFVSTRDQAMISISVIRKIKNEMIPATEWEKRGLKWEKP